MEKRAIHELGDGRGSDRREWGIKEVPESGERGLLRQFWGSCGGCCRSGRPALFT